MMMVSKDAVFFLCSGPWGMSHQFSHLYVVHNSLALNSDLLVSYSKVGKAIKAGRQAGKLVGKAKKVRKNNKTHPGRRVK